MCAFSRRKPLAASCIAAAVQRIAIEAERHRFTLRQTRRTVPITFSITLVQASERRSSFGNPSRVTVRISSMPSRIEPETPGPVSFETLGEIADQLFGLVGVVQLFAPAERAELVIFFNRTRNRCAQETPAARLLKQPVSGASACGGPGSTPAPPLAPWRAPRAAADRPAGDVRARSQQTSLGRASREHAEKITSRAGFCCWLFPDRRPGKPMTTCQLSRLFHETADAAGIKKSVTLHALRHNVAFRTMSRTVTGSAILAVNSGSPRLEAPPVTRHSFVNATSCPESSAADLPGENDLAYHAVVRFWRGPVQSRVEELANKRHIVDDRRRRQDPFLAQVPLKCLSVLFDRAQSTPAYLLDRDHVMITQKIEELPERSSITLANPLPPRAISKVLVKMPR